MVTNFLNEYIKYANTLIELNNQHKIMFGNEKNVTLPVCYTENLCKELCSEKYLEKESKYLLKAKEKTVKDRSYDMLTIKEKKVEIKATGNIKGTTTINKTMNFDLLYWLCFDFKFNIYIKVFEKQTVSTYLSERNSNKKPRTTIILKNLHSCFEKKYYITNGIIKTNHV